MNEIDKIKRLKELKIAQLELMNILHTHRLESDVLKRCLKRIERNLFDESFLLKKSLHSANSII